MKNLETLREIIIKEVPSILDLEFGCEGTDKYGNDWIYNGERWQGKDKLMFSILEPGKIIGRKITLVDVLAALWKNVKLIEIAHDGQFRIEDKSYYKGSYLPQWKLISDDLNYQSQECIDFLLNLLS